MFLVSSPNHHSQSQDLTFYVRLVDVMQGRKILADTAAFAAQHSLPHLPQERGIDQAFWVLASPVKLLNILHLFSPEDGFNWH